MKKVFVIHDCDLMMHSVYCQFCIPQLSQVINCVDPLLYVTLMDDTQGMIVDSTTVNVSLVTSTVTLEDIFTVLEDQHYTVSVSLTIINGSYTVTNTTSFSE